METGLCIGCHQSVTVAPFRSHPRHSLSKSITRLFIIFLSEFVDLAFLLISLALKLLWLPSICGHAFQPGMYFKSTFITSRKFHEKDTFGFGRGSGVWL
jgi:hypothetical protein